MLVRHYEHHEESHECSLEATLDPASLELANNRHLLDGINLGAAASAATTSRWKQSRRWASVETNLFGQKLGLGRLVASDLSGWRRKFVPVGTNCPQQLDHFLEAAESFLGTCQLVRSLSEPILPQKVSQKANDNCRPDCPWAKSLNLRKQAGKEHEDLARSAVSSGGDSNGELHCDQTRSGIMLWRSVRRLWHLSYFWIDFVHYQLETWRQLVGQVSSTAARVRRSFPSSESQGQDHKMSASSSRWPADQAKHIGQRKRPSLSAASRSQSEAAPYYREVNLDGKELNTDHYHVDADIYLANSNEIIPTTPQRDHYSRPIYGDHFKRLELRHHRQQQQLTKMNTMDGSPVASSQPRRAPLLNQRTMDSGQPSRPNSYATRLLGDQFSSSGSQLAFHPSALSPEIFAETSYQLYGDGSIRPHNDVQPHYRAPASGKPPVISVGGAPHLFGTVHGGHRQAPKSYTPARPIDLVASSTDDSSCYSQSSLIQQLHYAQGLRANHRQTAISSDSELHSQARQSITLGGLASRQQVAANTGQQQQQWHLGNERLGARPLYRQASAVLASSPAGSQQQQQHEFCTDLTGSARIQQRAATINARNSKKTPNLVKLSLEGAKRRLGFKQEGSRLRQLSIQRSEEVLPFDSELERFQDQIATSSLADLNHSRLESSCCGSPFHWSLTGSSSASRSPFIEGLGPGQVYSRQALVSPDIGDLLLTLCNRHGALEITVIKARRLHLKLGTNQKPSPYIKVYLIKDRKCIAKWRTLPAMRTLEPEYEQSFVYRGDFTNCAVQIIVWGDYGRKDRKSFMGIVQICTDDLELSSTITGWYKLFNAPSMINLFNSSKQMRQRILPERMSEAHSKSH